MYTFDEHYAISKIEEHWKDFMDKTKSSKCVIGISGGIDSTCVTALACKIFGKENVYGVSLPCDEQSDIADVIHVFSHFGINRLEFNIGDVFHNVLNGVENNSLEVSETTRTNLPARLRMSILYALAQSIPGAMVINTCNLSETLQNYDTLFGDDCGSYAPIKNLTKTEVRKLSSWLGVPKSLVEKVPVDGLQPMSDEERFGYSYEVLDRYIRTGEVDYSILENIIKRYNSGKYKMKMVNIEGPEFDFPDYIQEKNIR